MLPPGGPQALVHKSELSWDVVMRPEQVVQPGQTVSAVVVDVDRTRARIALSLKRMQARPAPHVSCIASAAPSTLPPLLFANPSHQEPRRPVALVSAAAAADACRHRRSP